MHGVHCQTAFRMNDVYVSYLMRRDACDITVEEIIYLPELVRRLDVYDQVSHSQVK